MWQISVGTPPATPAEADTALEWLVAWTSLAGILIWPLVFLIVLIAFRSSIQELIPKLTKAGAGPLSLDFAAKLDQAEAIAEALPPSAETQKVSDEDPDNVGDEIDMSPQFSGFDPGELNEEKVNELERLALLREAYDVAYKFNWSKWVDKLPYHRRHSVLSAMSSGGLPVLLHHDSQAALLYVFEQLFRNNYGYQPSTSAADFVRSKRSLIPSSLAEMYENIVSTGRAASSTFPQPDVTPEDVMRFEALVKEFNVRLDPFRKAMKSS